MAWSSKFYLVTMLDLYIGPTPLVADFVRDQLQTHAEKMRIHAAIRDRINGTDTTLGLYRSFLSRSGLDFQSKTPGLEPLIREGVVQNALYDLTTAGRVNLSQLKLYSITYDVRVLFEQFFIENQTILEKSEKKTLWWDEPIPTDGRPWLSVQLQRDPKFLSVLECWLDDNMSLQQTLDHFESNTRSANNPETKDRVFSHKLAVGAIEFAQVRHLK